MFYSQARLVQAKRAPAYLSRTRLMTRVVVRRITTGVVTFKVTVPHRIRRTILRVAIGSPPMRIVDSFAIALLLATGWR